MGVDWLNAEKEEEMGTRWISVNNKLPHVPKKELVKEGILFKVEGKVFAGHYHMNGCFYTDNNKTMARTPFAEKNYDLSVLPEKVCTHWKYLPKD